MDEEQLRLLGQAIATASIHKELGTEPPAPILKRPSATDVGYWLRVCLAEMKGGLDAHMELYARGSVPGVAGGNPGRWDADSSYGALQAVEDAQVAHFLEMVRPVSVLAMPLHLRRIADVLRAYLTCSRQMPLVREGAVSEHSKVAYVKLLIGTFTTVQAMLSPTGGDVGKLWNTFRNQRYLS